MKKTMLFFMLVGVFSINAMEKREKERETFLAQIKAFSVNAIKKEKIVVSNSFCVSGYVGIFAENNKIRATFGDGVMVTCVVKDLNTGNYEGSTNNVTGQDGCYFVEGCDADDDWTIPLVYDYLKARIAEFESKK